MQLCFLQPTCLVCAPHSVPVSVPGPHWPVSSAALPFSAGCGHPAWRLFQSPVWSPWSPTGPREYMRERGRHCRLFLWNGSICFCWMCIVLFNIVMIKRLIHYEAGKPVRGCWPSQHCGGRPWRCLSSLHQLQIHQLQKEEGGLVTWWSALMAGRGSPSNLPQSRTKERKWGLWSKIVLLEVRWVVNLLEIRFTLFT